MNSADSPSRISLKRRVELWSAWSTIDFMNWVERATPRLSCASETACCTIIATVRGPGRRWPLGITVALGSGGGGAAGARATVAGTTTICAGSPMNSRILGPPAPNSISTGRPSTIS
jgi:hypothetical protein